MPQFQTQITIAIGKMGVIFKPFAIFSPNNIFVPFEKVIKITISRNRNFILFKSCRVKIEYDGGSFKNSIADVRIVSRISFLEYISQFSYAWEIEIRN